jgi:hypothetical protein
VALDVVSRRVVAMIVGDRSGDTARCLWDDLPEENQAGARIFTDFWAAYCATIPAGQPTRAARGRGSLLTSSGSGARSAGDAADSCASRGRYLGATRTTSGRCDISSTMAMRHCVRAITRLLNFMVQKRG